MPLNNNTNGCLTINTQVNLNTTRSNSQATRVFVSIILIVLYLNKFKLGRSPFSLHHTIVLLEIEVSASVKE